MVPARRGKPFYPARFFRHRTRYSVRACEHCGARLTPKVRSGVSKDGLALETPKEFGRRRFCNKSCSSQHRIALERAQREVAPRQVFEVLERFGGLPLSRTDLVDELGWSKAKGRELNEALAGLMEAGRVGAKPCPDYPTKTLFHSLEANEEAA